MEVTEDDGAQDSITDEVPTNVRSKVEQLVKTKFGDIVNEMRKKTSLATSSFIAVQKWAEPRVFKGSESACHVQANENLKIEQHNVVQSLNKFDSEDEGEEVVEPQEELFEADQDKELNFILNSSTIDDTIVDETDVDPDNHSTESQPNTSKKKSLITILQKFSLNSIDLTPVGISTTEEPKLESSQTPPATPHPSLTFTSTNLASVGKNKITELYDKISRSKERYRTLKSRNMDLKSTLLSESDNSATIEEGVDEDDENRNKIVGVNVIEDNNDEKKNDVPPQTCADSKQIIQFQFDESLATDTTLTVEATTNKSDTLKTQPTVTTQASLSDDEPNARSDTISPSPMSCSSTTTDSRLNIPNATATDQQTRRVGIGDIGRSVSDNPNSKNKKNALADIGRSFSVAHDEETFVPGEGNNSCPNPSSLNTSSIIEVNNSENCKSASNNNVMQINSVPASPLTIGRMADPKLVRDALQNRRQLLRDSSFMSDSSQCSSVESLLEARRPDPEEILINLGFGPPQTPDILSRIPKRFLKPSQVRGIDTDAFIRQQQLAQQIHESSCLGYRGLVGNPDLPPSTIVGKIIERFHQNELVKAQELWSRPRRPSQAEIVFRKRYPSLRYQSSEDSSSGNEDLFTNGHTDQTYT